MRKCSWPWDKPQHVHHVCVLAKGHGGTHRCRCRAVYT